ncbi:MAG: prepilin peptidase [Betaproteobacteria bacterium]|nr:prepilin peptidase [Betaproteobacteria bacterium]MBI2226922.1 prepilin peptidase [Betaproteobacteria bacterium]MBI3056695.1 prepilin peptidase [Betaproteobacteria bacterium]
MLQAFQAHPALLVITIVLASLVVGSFLNVVIHRLPKMLERQWRAEFAEHTGHEPAPEPRYNLAVPRSQCPSCGHRITALENIPVVSYFVLGGRCSACKGRISPRYPIVEALTGALSGYVVWRYGFSWQALAALFFVWAMIALAFIDLDTFYLPDDITLPLIWTGLLVNLGGLFVDLPSAVIGAAAGYLALWSVFWAYKLATGKEGMGYGDFKLLAGIGAWLGWKMLPVVILLSSFVGAIVGISLIVFARHGRNVPIPFGPYLVLGGLAAMFWGDALIQYYLQTL